MIVTEISVRGAENFMNTDEMQEIYELKKENEHLRNDVNTICAALDEIYGTYGELVKLAQKNMENNFQISNELRAAKLKIDNFKYEISDPRMNGEHFFYPRFRSNEETICLINDEKKSLARFGDGEFSLAFHIQRQKFQCLDEKLSERIWQILSGDVPDNLLIGIADNYGSLDKYNDKTALAIREYMTESVRSMHQQLLNETMVYSDAYITRPYVIYKDVFSDEPRRRFELLKTIWAKKNIVIVEGAQTRLGVRNDLFEGCATIKRIIAPATDSFSRYKDILNACIDIAPSADMFLLAIGPSSGVLAYDLSIHDIQAIDVGHVDLEYEWFLAGKGERVQVPYKYNNEVQEGEKVEEIHDVTYEAQIVASFT